MRITKNEIIGIAFGAMFIGLIIFTGIKLALANPLI